MTVLRRAVSLSCILVMTAISSAIGAAAQGTGQFLAAGNYNFRTQHASFNFTPTDPTLTAVNELDVTREIDSSSPLGGQTTTSDITTLRISVSTNFGFGTPTFNGCFELNAGDFTVDPGPQSATLATSLDPQTPTCPGGQNFLTSSMDISVSWTGEGPIQSLSTITTFSCAGYTSESNGGITGNIGSASMTMSGLVDPMSADQQLFSTRTNRTHAQGPVPPEGCSGSVGRGAGFPTPAAGNYHTTLQEAGIFDFSQGFVFVTVDRRSQTSNPLAGPSSSSNQITASLSIFTTAIGVGGCFLVTAPGDFNFASDLSRAALATTVTGDTPGCGAGGNGIAPPDFSINVAWTGTGHIATTRTQTLFACLRYHEEIDNVQMLNSSVSASLLVPGLTSPLTLAGSLGMVDTRSHAAGVVQPGCSFRGF